ncbi:MAG: hypothetical protein JSU69_08430 [Candidatus Zixiibacteriota bacterium]|nr:MAG: hypothetical protein JSU69_08430 [candidate division Zixibacteria bacterium]
MRRLTSFLLIALVAGITVLGIIPGCDKLVTNEFYDTTTIIDTIRDSTCVDFCHSDVNNTMDIARRQWENSGHAMTDPYSLRIGSDEASACGTSCHSEEGLLRSLGETASNDNFLSEIGCITCHAPHTTWDFSVRDTTAVTLADGASFDYSADTSNICAHCHRLDFKAGDYTLLGVIDPTWRVVAEHSMGDADLLAGVGGYEFSLPVDDLVHSHKDTAGCVTCHQKYAQGFTLGGHSLSIVSEGDLLADACNQDACHAGDVDATYMTDRQAIVASLIDNLKSRLIKLGWLDDSGDLDTSAIIPVGGADSLGALYNYFFMRNDGSMGMHNFGYDTLLLQRSLDYIGAAPPPKR